MKTIALFLFAAAVVFGDVEELSSGAAFLAAANVADRVEIEKTRPDPKPKSVALPKTEEIRSFLALFRFSDVPLRGERIVVDGKVAWIVTPCQCLGDYRVRFFRKDAEIVSITFHHQQFIRVEGKKGGQEFDLISESGAKIREYLAALVKERANQSLEPTSVLGTSAAEQPLVPSTLVAHL